MPHLADSHPVDPPIATWPDRLRFFAIVGGVLAAALLVLDPLILGRLEHQPTVLVGGRFGLIGGILAAVLIRLLLIAAKKISGHEWLALCGVGTGLALWSLTGPSIDQWLSNQSPQIGPPRGSAYWPLFADVILLMSALGDFRWLQGDFGDDSAATPRPAGAQEFDWRGLLLTTVIAVVLVSLLTGPIIDRSRPLQLAFAVVAGISAAMVLNRQFGGSHDARQYVALPFVLALIGALIAAVWPAFRIPAEYQHLNSVAAWGLVRPLPVQMIGFGLATVLWHTIPQHAATASENVPAAQLKLSQDGG